MADLRHLANVLKVASSKWCEFLPSVSMWHVKAAELISDTKKCSNISVGKSPTISLNSEHLNLKNRLEHRSILTLHLTSSITKVSLDAYLEIPCLSLKASLIADPKVIATSSIVWCSSISRSPRQEILRSIEPCFENCSNK